MASKSRAPRCPVCRGVLPEMEESPERGPKYAPMCSLRCKRIDLATWLGEGYRIAGEPAHDEMRDAERGYDGDPMKSRGDDR